MENLTKENFWNDLKIKYPSAMKLFCNWIDEYKKDNNWDKLFNSDSEYQNADGKNAPSPKFHDLPVAMQMGIWIQFGALHHPMPSSTEYMFYPYVKNRITGLMADLELLETCHSPKLKVIE